MATYDLGKCVSLLSGEDLSHAQYKFVSAEKILDARIRLCGDGQIATGILIEPPVPGPYNQMLPGFNESQVCAVMIDCGISKMVCGAPISAGDMVSSDSQGRAVPCATGDVRLGRCLESSDEPGTLISVLFQPGFRSTL